MTKYAFSLNGTEWSGSFTARKDARLAAFDAARAQVEPPGVIYVGKIVPADPQTTGHADTVLRSMSQRADAAGNDGYMRGVKIEHVQDLDRELSGGIQRWLDRNGLAPTTFTVDAISEYPVPTPRQVSSPPVREINEIGAEPQY